MVCYAARLHTVRCVANRNDVYLLGKPTPTYYVGRNKSSFLTLTVWCVSALLRSAFVDENFTSPSTEWGIVYHCPLETILTSKKI